MSLHLVMPDLLLVWMSPSFSASPSEPSPSCCAVVVLMAPVLELILPGPAGWPSTAVSPYALLRPDTNKMQKCFVKQMAQIHDIDMCYFLKWKKKRKL